MLPVDVDGADHPTEVVLAESGVVAESLDVEETSVGIEANLPQGGKVSQHSADGEVAGVVDGPAEDSGT